jgi:hypothetical protein
MKTLYFELVLLVLCQQLPQAPKLPQSTPAPQSTIAWVTDYNSAWKRAERDRKPVLILYTRSVGCPACNRFAAGSLSNAKVIEESVKFVCVKIDTATPAGLRLAQSVGVDSVPYLTVHPQAGAVASGEVAGDQSTDVVLRVLQSVR